MQNYQTSDKKTRLSLFNTQAIYATIICYFVSL